MYICIKKNFKTMQAIILAAGMGKRLGAKTRENTKCMIEVGGVKLIDRMLDQLSDLNLSRIIIVTGYKGDSLRAHIEDSHKDLNIKYIDNPIYNRTNNIYSLSLASREMQEDDTLLLESDIILDDTILPMVMDSEFPNLAVVDKYQSWMDGTVVKINEDRDIVNFIPKKAFSFSEADQYYKTVNVYRFSREFSRDTYIPFLEAYIKTVGNNEYYEQVLRIITAMERRDFKALPLNGQKWYEIDDIQDLDNAETIFEKDGAKHLARLQKRYGGYWRFPEMKDFCYLVNPYFPPARMKDELRASLDTLLTQYPSGQNINSMLAGKYFSVNPEYICVGNGAAELIKALMEYFIDFDRVGVIRPTFEEYPNRLADNIVEFIPENSGFRYSADDIMEYFSGNPVQAVLLVNPDNPSGNFISHEEVLRLADWSYENGVVLVVDESFVDFAHDARSLLNDDILEKYPDLVVMKSISKSYGVPGLRLGILACSSVSLIDFLKKDVAIWNINSFAEFYLQIFNKYEFKYQEACTRIRAERDRFFSELQSIPYLEIFPSEANYFLCRVKEGTAKELTFRLLNDFNILIKDESTKHGINGEYIRIAVRDEADNNSILSALRSLAL